MNCSTFFHCFRSCDFVEQPCAEHLHFWEEMQICDFPEIVNCRGEYTCGFTQYCQLGFRFFQLLALRICTQISSKATTTALCLILVFYHVFLSTYNSKSNGSHYAPNKSNRIRQRIRNDGGKPAQNVFPVLQLKCKI